MGELQVNAGLTSDRNIKNFTEQKTLNEKVWKVRGCA